MMDEQNPYASPAIVESPTPPVETVATEAEQVRRRLIATEESILSIGSLLYVIGALCGIVALICLAAGLNSMSWHPTWWMMIINGVLWGLASAAFFAVGHGLRQLQSWAGWLIAIAACLGFVAMLVLTWATGAAALLVATPVFLYPIFLICGRKGQRVLTPEYAEIRHQTPHIRYRG